MGDAGELEFKEGPNREKLGIVINLENWRNYLCVCSCVRVHACACGGQRSTLGIVTQEPFSLFFEPGSAIWTWGSSSR